MIIPDWTEAHDDATHYNQNADLFCNADGWWCNDRYFKAEPGQMALHRYTPRPVEPVSPDWTGAPVGATHWDTNSKVWCKDSRFWDDDIWIQGYQYPGYVEKNYVARPVETATAPWNGTGRPPVGTECEVVIGEQKPRTVCFVGIKSSGSVVIETVDGELKSYHRSQVIFRPIRTQAQREREDLLKSIIEDYRTSFNSPVSTVELNLISEFANYLFEIGMLRRKKK